MKSNTVEMHGIVRREKVNRSDKQQMEEVMEEES